MSISNRGAFFNLEQLGPNGEYRLVALTEKEHEVLLKLINKELEVEKETSIESLVEYAKKIKKLAIEMYPDEAGYIEVYVDEDTKHVEFSFRGPDKFWNNIHRAKVLLKFNVDSYKKEDKVSRRIYV